ncbi:hypothetical protein CQ10_26200 [Bradyrhizobium valentinum]|nr:hypothetical protein CQ10_26200 [Bradyrhizobium valentinum]
MDANRADLDLDRRLLLTRQLPPQPVIATGTKPAGMPLSPRAPACARVAWRRQRNNRLGLMSCRRATADTLAPGTKLSATIAAFASVDQRRRRPVPVMISTR